jgi:hypothetical protein
VCWSGSALSFRPPREGENAEAVTAVWKFIQVSLVVGLVYSNMMYHWTSNGYLPVLIGIMLAFVVSEICFDLRLWWASLRKR